MLVGELDIEDQNLDPIDELAGKKAVGREIGFVVQGGDDLDPVAGFHPSPGHLVYARAPAALGRAEVLVKVENGQLSGDFVIRWSFD